MRKKLSSLLATGLLLGGLLGSWQAQAQKLNPGLLRADRGLEADLADQRLLRNVEPVLNATALVNRLRPVRYNIQSPLDPQLMGPLRMGFVAQQVIPVLPSTVRRDYDIAGTLHMDYTQMVPLLTRALQEQDSKLNLLSAEMAALNKEVVLLRQANSRMAVLMASNANTPAAQPMGGSPAQVRQLQQEIDGLKLAVGQLQQFMHTLTGKR